MICRTIRVIENGYFNPDIPTSKENQMYWLIATESFDTVNQPERFAKLKKDFAKLNKKAGYKAWHIVLDTDINVYAQNLCKKLDQYFSEKTSAKSKHVMLWR